MNGESIKRAGKDAGPFDLSAAAAKEILYESGGLHGQDAFHDLNAVVEDIGIGQLEFGPYAAESEITGTENKRVNAGVNQGAGAHDAGFQRHVDGGVVEAVVLHALGGGAEQVDFGVGGGVVRGDGGVVRAGDDLPVNNENGADRDLTRGLGQPGFFDGRAHIRSMFHVEKVAESDILV